MLWRKRILIELGHSDIALRNLAMAYEALWTTVWFLTPCLARNSVSSGVALAKERWDANMKLFRDFDLKSREALESILIMAELII